MVPGSEAQVLGHGQYMYDYVVQMFHTVALHIIYRHRNMSCQVDVDNTCILHVSIQITINL